MKLISGAKMSGGMKMIDSKSSSLSNVIAEDRKRKEEEKNARRMENLNKQINTNLEKFQKQNQLGWGGKVLKFLGLDYSQPLPNIVNETPEYTRARIESEQQYNINQEVNKTWYKEAAKKVKNVVIGTAKMTPLYPTITPEQQKERTELYKGAGKNLGELVAGTGKLALKAGMLPTQAGSAISEKLFGHSVDQVKQAEAFIDNNGIINYKPEYKNEAQQTGGTIAELGSWFIPITRFGKVAEGEKILVKALEKLPVAEKMFGITPKIVKSGGKFFYDVSKDAVDVAVLDALRGKNWDEIESDMPGVIFGGTFIRGGGKLIEANRLKKQVSQAVETLKKTVIGEISPKEEKVIANSIREGNTIDGIAKDIFESRKTSLKPESKQDGLEYPAGTDGTTIPVETANVIDDVTKWIKNETKLPERTIKDLINNPIIDNGKIKPDKDGFVTLWRKGNVQNGVPNNFSLEKKFDGQVPVKVKASDIILDTTSDKYIDTVSNTFTNKDARDAALGALEHANKTESEVFAMIGKPKIVKPVETPKIEVSTKKTESPILKKVNTMLDEASKLDDELPTTSFRKEFANAENRINKDPQKAYNDAIYGTKEDDVTKSALQLSLLENAKRKGDNKAIAEIGMAAAKHGRKAGQEVVMFRSLYDQDPMNKLLVDLANTKLHNIESRYPKFLRKILKKEEGDIVSTSSKAIKKKTPSIKDAQEIINSFICK